MTQTPKTFQKPVKPRGSQVLDSLKSRISPGLPYGEAFLRFRELFLVVGERGLGLAVNLLVLVLVERSHGQAGLGVFSYLWSFYHLTAYVAEWGMSPYVERETALHYGYAGKQQEVLRDGFQQVFLMALLAGVLCIASAAYDTTHTRIEEKMGAYFLIGLAVPLHNLNKLRLAFLNGQGRHEEAARLQGRKRLVFLGTSFLLMATGLQPSYLVAAFPVSELILARAGRKRQRLPALRSVWVGVEPLKKTLSQGSRLLLTDDALDVVLYLDLLILGFFVPAWDLGVYAEASILARFFLLIPTSIRPVFRRRFCVLASRSEHLQAAALFHKAALHLFALHSFVILLLLLFYPEILRFFFWTRGEELSSFRVFGILAPGLLFSASVLACEPLYEALGRTDSLRNLMMAVFGATVFLNLTLVPMAGLQGAAWATTLALVLHFLLFTWFLEAPYRWKMNLYLVAGGAVYVTYAVLEALEVGAAPTLVLLPVLLGVQFYGIGFFSEDPGTLGRSNDGGTVHARAGEEEFS